MIVFVRREDDSVHSLLFVRMAGCLTERTRHWSVDRILPPADTDVDPGVAFIYSCPSGSPIKSRMVYSTGAGIIFRQVRDLLGEERGFALASRKIETSDPKELTGAFLREELALGNGASDGNNDALTRPAVSNTSFARPKGPGRRR